MRPLMAKYPFNPSSKLDATLADVNAIFKPKEGGLWAFYDANLQKVLQRQGSQFVPVAGTGMTINPAFLAMMNRAAAFSDTAYANGAADPQFKFTIKPTLASDQDTIKFTINGETHEFSAAAAASQTYSWPGNSSGAVVAIKFKDGTPNEFPPSEGLWGIFHFIQEADKHQGSQVEWIASTGLQKKPLTHGGQPIVLTFDANANPPVFDKNYFAGMGCVADVAK
jgi:type VI secretion system protein ImpL